jgi:hypothetical protein
MVTFLTEGGDLSIMTATNNINGAWTGAGAQVACTEVVKGVGRSDVSDLFTFSASLGNVVTGAWSSATQLVLTIVDAGDGATYDQTRVGGLRMTVKATANLRTADESSPQSTDESDTLTGTWGVHDAPYILSFTAANTGGNAGLGNADTLTVTFNKNTNQPPVGTKAQIDAVFNETISLGTAYTGAWTDYATLVITVVTASVAPADLVTTKVGSFLVTVNTNAYLQSADESSPKSGDSTSSLTGTWGDHPAPAINSATAADGGFPNPSSGLSDGLNDHDTVTVVFDRETNRPAVGTKTDLDTLFTFSGTLGTDYTGSWNADYLTLVINVTNAATSAFATTKVGGLLLNVKSSATLLSADLSSPASESKALLAGTWGDHTTTPSIVSITAADGGAQGGLGDGDTVTVVFDSEAVRVSSEEVQTLSFVNATAGTFTLGYEGETTTTLAWNASDADIDTALESLITVGAGGVTVVRSGAGGDYVWTVTFTSCALCSGDLTTLAINDAALTATSNTVSSVVAGNTLTKTVVDTLLSQSTSICTHTSHDNSSATVTSSSHTDLGSKFSVEASVYVVNPADGYVKPIISRTTATPAGDTDGNSQTVFFYFCCSIWTLVIFHGKWYVVWG